MGSDAMSESKPQAAEDVSPVLGGLMDGACWKMNAGWRDEGVPGGVVSERWFAPEMTEKSSRTRRNKPERMNSGVITMNGSKLGRIERKRRKERTMSIACCDGRKRAGGRPRPH